MIMGMSDLGGTESEEEEVIVDTHELAHGGILKNRLLYFGFVAMTRQHCLESGTHHPFLNRQQLIGSVRHDKEPGHFKPRQPRDPAFDRSSAHLREAVHVNGQINPAAPQ